MAKVYELRQTEVWDGNMAASHALRQAQVDLMVMYPITPSTPIVQNYSTFLANGYVDGEMVRVESEHAAMSGCVGAAAAGGRVTTATSSQGLALMIEVLYQAAGMRLPIVLNLVNRALASPLNIHCDHGDMYLTRDTGWVSLLTSNPQEVYDFTLMAFKISENLKVRIPTIVNQDGFICSHTASNVKTLSDKEAYDFIGEYIPHRAMLDFDNPVSYGAQTEEEWYYEHRALLHHTLMESKSVIEEVFAEFAKITGRKYGLVEGFDMDDADIAILAIGTVVGTARMAAKNMRKNGIKAGVITIKALRPLPIEQLRRALSSVKAVAIMDRCLTVGSVPALFSEISSIMYNEPKRPIISSYIYGLGERDITIKELEEVFAEVDKNAKANKLETYTQQFIGVRGPKIAFK